MSLILRYVAFSISYIYKFIFIVVLKERTINSIDRTDLREGSKITNNQLRLQHKCSTGHRSRQTRTRVASRMP